LGIAGGRRP
jgi:phosphatidylethanolamine-binding protein (PEBP) family uncharacterized protein